MDREGPAGLRRPKRPADTEGGEPDWVPEAVATPEPPGSWLLTRALGALASARLDPLVVDMVPAVPVRVALSAASSPLLAEPSAGALRGEYFRRAVPQSQVSNPDLVLDSHGGECRPWNARL
jgi:hypothetical protein